MRHEYFFETDFSGPGSCALVFRRYHAGNDPILFTDPTGTTYQTNTTLLWQWLSGQGATNRSYSQNDIEINEMMNSPAAQLMRQQFKEGGCAGISNFTYGTGQAAADTLANPTYWSSTALQVGGFANASIINNGNGTLTFTIPNVAGTNSFFYHMVPNRTGNMGPMRNINQVFQWTEPIGGCKCK
jgi:hypothetical protein